MSEILRHKHLLHYHLPRCGTVVCSVSALVIEGKKSDLTKMLIKRTMGVCRSYTVN